MSIAMKTKLTLRLDKKIIDLAKRFSKKTKQPISKMVENYFVGLGNTDKSISLDENLPPLVKSLRGCLAGADISIEDYKKHLEKRYL